MVRVARWLLSDVGEGDVFTKEQLRETFPGVSQIDRRMRDLRDYGWILKTNREDASLAQHELRFVSAGDPVWDPKNTRKLVKISAAERREALAAASYMCEICGISGGEHYSAVESRTAVLSVSASAGYLKVECQLCQRGEEAVLEEREASRVAEILERLSPQELGTIVGWLENGRKPQSVEQVWSSALRSQAVAQLVTRKWRSRSGNIED